MSKENRWLIINAAILAMVGLLVTLLVGFYINNQEKKGYIEQYQTYISDVSDYKTQKLKNKYLTQKITLLDKNKKEVGFAYVGEDSVTGIPGTDGKRILRIQLVVENDLIKGAFVDYSEHTPEFIEYVEDYFKDLPGTELIDYRNVDEVAGASEFSMPIVRAVIDAATLLHTEKEPNPKITETPYETLFGEGAVAEVDASFTPTELVTKKEIVKDDTGNILGYAYTATGNADEDIPRKGKAPITILVGIDSLGKAKGVVVLDVQHTNTPIYFGNYYAEFDKLPGKDLADLAVDVIGGASISGRLINVLLDAVKAVAANE